MGITLKEVEEDPIIKKHMEKNNITSLDEFYYHVGEKRSKIDIIIDKLRTKIENERASSNITIEDLMEKKKEQSKTETGKNDYGVIIDGVSNTLVRFARCCTPLPGDNIGGFVTKLTGITIHRRDCKNFQSMVARDPSREIEVHWDKDTAEKKQNKYKFTFNVLVYDRPNILMELVNMIANHKIYLASINSNEINKDGKKLMNFQITIEISEKNEYKYLLNNMLRLKDVISVDRT